MNTGSLQCVCDDPELCTAPFLAAKNVHYPDRGEIASLEYYLEHIAKA